MMGQMTGSGAGTETARRDAIAGAPRLAGQDPDVAEALESAHAHAGNMSAADAAAVISQVGIARNRRAARANLLPRYLWFVVGVAINSFGIAFITKAALGTSPVSSVPYVLDLAFEPTLGEFTFILNTIYVIIQIALLRRDFKPVQLLQLVANLVFSAILDVSMGLLWWLSPTELPAQVLALLIGIATLGVGVSIEVAPNVITVPGEGIVRVIAAVSGIRFGSVKIAFDVALVAISTAMSLVFFGELRGIGIGTLATALLVGRFCNLCNRRVPLIAHIAGLSRSATGAPHEAI